MARRRQARTAALQLLYQRDVNPEIDQHIAHEMLDELVETEDLREFAWQIYTGTLSIAEEVDRKIQAVSENWRVSRMSPTDRNIIRMGVYEMTMMGTAPAVVLDECIEIAREFGSVQSGQFVNGVLDKMIPEATE
ncbi:MAG: transcription antitermination factor NusB [Planctomycetota bacterium]|nr:transcription antitermination factor NusB [Planctomycetota bacterium]MDA0918567.1 transcription antitermination factor NusB [Planctomycetota bacterium]MDA1161431.1 transcription antitermination factor NusB [Planctomycetota bacterium]